MPPCRRLNALSTKSTMRSWDAPLQYYCRTHPFFFLFTATSTFLVCHHNDYLPPTLWSLACTPIRLLDSIAADMVTPIYETSEFTSLKPREKLVLDSLSRLVWFQQTCQSQVSYFGSGISLSVNEYRMQDSSVAYAVWLRWRIQTRIRYLKEQKHQ